MIDLIDEDIEELLSPQFLDLDSREKYERLKDVLQFDQFAPSRKPTTLHSDLYNPAIDGYLSHGHEWEETGWTLSEETAVLQTYPEYVPTDEAIQSLIEYGPLVEVGAGRGYWAHVIDTNGGDCLPTDIAPETVDSDEYPVRIDVDEDYSYTVWSEVRELGGVEAVKKTPERNVLMCHPDGATRWSEDVLEAIDDQYFIYVGEWFPGADSNPMFFNKLTADWELRETFPVYDWGTMHCRGYVFKRR